MQVVLSPFLLAAAAAWVIAHLIKYAVASIRSRNPRQFRQFYTSGSMPSAHSATVVALLVVVGLIEGPDSAVFALTALMSAIVMYDAMMVRRSSGEQGIALRELLKGLKSKVIPPRVAKGHTPLEVAAGAVLGLVVGLIVYAFSL
jgi:acid phosphatase family membrane protein YuiD